MCTSSLIRVTRVNRNPRRDGMDELASGVLTLLLSPEYTFRSTRTSMAHTTVAPECLGCSECVRVGTSGRVARHFPALLIEPAPVAVS